MSDRRPIPQETVATRAAFRAGVKGMRYTENPDPDFDIPVVTDTSPGPNESHFKAIERLPGLSDPESAFETGRHLAAWLGLTPQEHSTGGKQRMGGISRAGNERLRSLLVEGAMSVITAVETRGSKLATPWLLAMLARRPKKVVAVALANKMARMIWAMMTRREAYRRPAAAGAGCRPAVVS